MKKEKKKKKKKKTKKPQNYDAILNNVIVFFLFIYKTYKT